MPRTHFIPQRKLPRTTISDPGHSIAPDLKQPPTSKKRTRAIWLSFLLWLSNKPRQIETLECEKSDALEISWILIHLIVITCYTDFKVYYVVLLPDFSCFSRQCDIIRFFDPSHLMIFTFRVASGKVRGFFVTS